jgi:hypothetical protein
MRASSMKSTWTTCAKNMSTSTITTMIGTITTMIGTIMTTIGITTTTTITTAGKSP